MTPIERAKTNKRFPDIEGMCKQCGNCQEMYDEVLRYVAGNVKMGPWTATSGVVLPYYLNASTNYLDPKVAPKIARLFADFMCAWLPPLPAGEKYLVCGMEMAGGLMAGQLASLDHSKMNQLGDYVYIRKDKKTSGTCQQLEGPNFITLRTPDSPAIKGVWVDDANSTGSSLKAGIKLLKQDYNIEVTHALYLVDRYHDRQSIPDDKQHLADPLFEHVDIKAVFDLEQVDALVPK